MGGPDVAFAPLLIGEEFVTLGSHDPALATLVVPRIVLWIIQKEPCHDGAPAMSRKP